MSASAYEDAYHKEYPDSDIQFSDASASDLPPKPPTLTPQEAATCDRQYWSCPGHNKLKVGHVAPKKEAKPNRSSDHRCSHLVDSLESSLSLVVDI